jgi:hypothetical protein
MTPKKAHEQDWYERLKLIAERSHKRERTPTLGSAPTILEETAALDVPELVTRP